MKPSWTRQIGAVLRLELRKSFLSRRGWWIYCLALGPVALTLVHWLVFRSASVRGKSHRAAYEPQPGRRQPGVRRALHVLLPAGRDLLRLHGDLLQPLSRRDAGEDAALLLPHAHAPRDAGGREIPRGPGGGAGAVRRQRDRVVPASRRAFRARLDGLPAARPRPAPARRVPAGNGASLRSDTAPSS